MPVSFNIRNARRTYVPALDLRFADDRSLTPRVGYAPTLTRASAAWDFDSVPSLQEHAINVPRFPYNFSDGSSLGLRLEQQRANKIDNTNGRLASLSGLGTTPPTVTTVAETTPFGSEFVRVTFPSGVSGFSDSRVIGRVFGRAAGEVITATVWLRNFDSRIRLYIANFSGSLQSTGRAVGEWNEYATTRTSDSNHSTNYLAWYVQDVAGAEASVDIAIGQVETGSYATTPILGAADIARSADVFSLTGTNFSNVWNHAAGTVVYEFIPAALVTNSRYLSIDDGTGDNRIQIYTPSGGNLRLLVTVGGITTLLTGSTALVPEQTHKVAIAWSTSEGWSLCIDGNLSTSSVTSVPVVNQLTWNPLTTIGDQIAQRLRLHREKLPDAKLQELTS